MTDEERADLRERVGRVVRAARSGVWWQTATGPLPDATCPPLDPARQLALSVLVGAPGAVVENALADYLLDQGHEYAAAVAEKARAEERERIAERLYSEASFALTRDGDMGEYAAAALSSVADDLVFDRPPTAPTTRR